MVRRSGLFFSNSPALIYFVVILMCYSHHVVIAEREDVYADGAVMVYNCYNVRVGSIGCFTNCPHH